LYESSEITKIAMFFHFVNHFTFGVYDKHTNTFYYHDSLYDKTDKIGEQNFETLSDLFNKITGSTTKFVYIFGTQTELPPINCGVFCICYLERWIRNESIPARDGSNFLSGELTNATTEQINTSLVRERFCDLIHKTLHIENNNDISFCILCKRSKQNKISQRNEPQNTKYTLFKKELQPKINNKKRNGGFNSEERSENENEEAKEEEIMTTESKRSTKRQRKSKILYGHDEDEEEKREKEDEELLTKPAWHKKDISESIVTKNLYSSKTKLDNINKVQISPSLNIKKKKCNFNICP